jgi:hypothetical protein
MMFLTSISILLSLFTTFISNIKIDYSTFMLTTYTIGNTAQKFTIELNNSICTCSSNNLISIHEICSFFLDRYHGLDTISPNISSTCLILDVNNQIIIGGTVGTSALPIWFAHRKNSTLHNHFIVTTDIVVASYFEFSQLNNIPNNYIYAFHSETFEILSMLSLNKIKSYQCDPSLLPILLPRIFTSSTNTVQNILSSYIKTHQNVSQSPIIIVNELDKLNDESVLLDCAISLSHTLLSPIAKIERLTLFSKPLVARDTVPLQDNSSPLAITATWSTHLQSKLSFLVAFSNCACIAMFYVQH